MWKLLMGILAILMITLNVQAGGDAGPMVTVYRSPSCGCCGQWIAHLRQNGFKAVEITDRNMAEIKRRHGVPSRLRSCHTALVEGYVIEGHVPAADIRRLLREKPKVNGLAVPGMPVGAPGMEMGTRKDDYVVWSFDEGGSIDTFATH